MVVSDYLVPLGLILTVLGLWFSGSDRVQRMHQQVGVFVALTAMALSSLAVFLINIGYSRLRPFETYNELALLFYRPTDPSFPSNAVAAAAGLSAAVWGINRQLGTSMLTATIVWGLARIYAGVHYPSDVLASLGIGIVAAFLSFKIRDLLNPIPTWVVKIARLFCLA